MFSHLADRNFIIRKVTQALVTVKSFSICILTILWWWNGLFFSYLVLRAFSSVFCSKLCLDGDPCCGELSHTFKNMQNHVNLITGKRLCLLKGIARGAKSTKRDHVINELIFGAKFYTFCKLGHWIQTTVKHIWFAQVGAAERQWPKIKVKKFLKKSFKACSSITINIARGTTDPGYWARNCR